MVCCVTWLTIHTPYIVLDTSAGINSALLTCILCTLWYESQQGTHMHMLLGMHKYACTLHEIVYALV